MEVPSQYRQVLTVDLKSRFQNNVYNAIRTVYRNTVYLNRKIMDKFFFFFLVQRICITFVITKIIAY